jgi:outer membrane protein assembly factor BamB/ubiquinone/menaquinone biosynthesis C-methylase UbiE
LFCVTFVLAFCQSHFIHAAVFEARKILDAAGVQGGLVVHVGCGTGQLTAALRIDERYLVHGLDTASERVAQGRRFLTVAGKYGPVTLATFDGRHLPYADGVVNLIVSEDLGEVSASEVMRVLSPGGVAYVRQDREWTKTVKPWPDNIDQWTHYLHGPDNNAVAHDSVVAEPYHVQWVGAPRWARHHNHLSSTSASVSANGRLFSIVDEGPIASLMAPPRWVLVARDAFSGVVLWKKPVGPWEGVLRPFRSGPPDMPRRLVAVGDRVFVTLGYDQPVSVLDAATGEVDSVYDATQGAVEILVSDGRVFAVVGDLDTQAYEQSRRRGSASPPVGNKRIVAIDQNTGNVLWTKSDAETGALLPSTLAVSDGYLYFQNPEDLVCIGRDGGAVWKVARPVRRERLAWSTPTLVVHKDIVLSADCAAGQPDEDVDSGSQVKWTVSARPKRGDASMGELIAFSTQDGRELWRCPAAQGYNAPVDVFVVDGLVWASYAPNRDTTDFTIGRDLYTGEIKRQLKTDGAFTVTHHHRCYRNKATDRFILLGRTGVEWIDLAGAPPARHCWVRGACQYGVMPANGLLYSPPHACACYIQSKLSGFWALAPRRASDPLHESEPQDRLQEGPAFGKVTATDSLSGDPQDWPTHRHDAARTGRTGLKLATDFVRQWKTRLGAPLTSPVIARGVLLVAEKDQHMVHALDAASGKGRWEFHAGGRIDSPPTVYAGLAIFGCADGYVYCLRLADGHLVWRFRAAPWDRRIVALGQVESVWPATGSVLVHDDVVYCTSGRSSYLDGGMYLLRLDVATGELLGETRFDSRDPETGGQPEELIEDVELPGTLPDVLVYDGEHLFLRDKVLNLAGQEIPVFKPHLYSSAGLLDDAWWHRTYWLWGERNWGRASGWAVMSRYRPSGRILAMDETTVFGYGRKAVTGNSLQGYRLFRADKKVKPIDRRIKNNNVALAAHQRPGKVIEHWSREVPLVVRALVLTSDMLLAAGPVMPPQAAVQAEPNFAVGEPARLAAFRIVDGEPLGATDLSEQPVFDGMAVAQSRVYLSLVDGSVACYGSE